MRIAVTADFHWCQYEDPQWVDRVVHGKRCINVGSTFHEKRLWALDSTSGAVSEMVFRQ